LTLQAQRYTGTLRFWDFRHCSFKAIARHCSFKIFFFEDHFLTQPAAESQTLPLDNEIISRHKISQDGATINMSHLSFKISLLSLGFSRARFQSL
jgi:hypothetical protein